MKERRMIFKILWVILLGVFIVSCSGGGGGGSSGSTNTTTSSNSTPNKATFSLSVKVSGLQGALSVSNLDGQKQQIKKSGTFVIEKNIPKKSKYNLTIVKQPTGQVCEISNSKGIITQNLTIKITCSNLFYEVGGSVSGLIIADSFKIQNNGIGSLILTSNGNFTFSETAEYGSNYAVSILEQATAHTCQVSSGNGVVSKNVNGISVNCTLNSYSVGGDVSGLVGTVQLENNGADILSITSDGSFVFDTSIDHGSTYNVQVSNQPTGQTCTVGSGFGTISGNVVGVSIVCSDNFYNVGGTLSGASGSVTLQNNGGDNLLVNANGSFVFSTQIGHGGSYGVSVLTPPAGQTCSVGNSTGTATNDVNNVSVVCSTLTYSISGNISGLSGTVVLQNNNADDINLNADGSFAFPLEVAHSGTYSVTVKTQPAGQTCSVNMGGGTATADVSNVSVNCSSNSYSVGGAVSGLSGTVVLQNNSSDDLTLNSNGAFTFDTEVVHGSSYSVTIKSQPIGQTCTVSDGSGTATSAVTNVSVSCATTTYSLSGTINNLSGYVTLKNNNLDTFTSSYNGTTLDFGSVAEHGETYNITVSSQPSSQVCSVDNGSGTATADVSNIIVSCVDSYWIHVNVSGLSGTLVLQNNLSDDLNITSNGQSTFSQKVVSGSDYDVTVLTNPASQNCIVSSGSGTATANVWDVDVTCTDYYSVGGTVSGLSGTLVLQNNGGDDINITTDGSYAFPEKLLQGEFFEVSILSEPAAQDCGFVFVGNTKPVEFGFIPGNNVTSVNISCASSPLSLSGSVTGLVGELVLRQAAGGQSEYVSVTTDGSFTFSTPFYPGSAYWVGILKQPQDSYCTLTGGYDTFVSSDVSDISVECVSVTSMNELAQFQNPEYLRGVVDGGYTYLVANNSLTVMDSSTPESPSLVSRLPFYESHDVEVAGNYLFVTGDDEIYSGYGIGVTVVDVSVKSTPAIVTNVRLGGYVDAEAIDINGNYAYVAASDRGGLYVLDISDPESPFLASSYKHEPSDIDEFFDLIYDSGLVYIAGRNGLTIIDVSNPLLPSLVYQHDPNQVPGYELYSTSIDKSGDYVFLAGNSGLRILDVSNPATPVLVYDAEDYWFSEGVKVIGNYAYVSIDDSWEPKEELHLYDISDPTTPVLIDVVYGHEARSFIPVDGNYAYLTTIGYESSSTLTVVDTRQFPLITVLGSVQAAYDVSDIEVISNTAYLAELEGISIYDFTTPLNSSRQSHLDLGVTIKDIDIDGTTLYAAGTDGLYIVDVSDSANPTLENFVGTGGESSNVKVSGGVAFVSYQLDGLMLLDVSDPASPVLLNDTTTFQGSFGLDAVISGDNLFLAAQSGGLEIIDVSTPGTLAEVGNYSPVDSNVTGVALVGNTAYLTDATNGLLLIDVTTPGSPALLSSLPVSDGAYSVVVQGNYAYVASGFGGVSIIDISNSLAPAYVTNVPVPGESIKVTLTGTNIYATNVFGDVFMVDVTDPLNPDWQFQEHINWTSGKVQFIGDYAYVNDFYGLSVYDNSDVSAPVRLGGSFGDAFGDFEIDGDYAFIISRKVFEVVDISDPYSPLVISSIDVIPTSGLGYIYSVELKDNYAFITGSNFFTAVDVSDVFNPQLTGSEITLSNSGKDIAIYGNYAYVGLHDNTTPRVRIFDISDPASIVDIGDYSTSVAPLGVEVMGDYLYLTESGNLEIVDLTNPELPSQVYSNYFSSWAYPLVIHGGFGYLNTSGTLLVLDLTNPIAPVLSKKYSGSRRLMGVGDTSIWVSTGDVSMTVIEP